MSIIDLCPHSVPHILTHFVFHALQRGHPLSGFLGLFCWSFWIQHESLLACKFHIIPYCLKMSIFTIWCSIIFSNGKILSLVHFSKCLIICVEDVSTFVNVKHKHLTITSDDMITLNTWTVWRVTPLYFWNFYFLTQSYNNNQNWPIWILSDISHGYNLKRFWFWLIQIFLKSMISILNELFDHNFT